MALIALEPDLVWDMLASIRAREDEMMGDERKLLEEVKTNLVKGF